MCSLIASHDHAPNAGSWGIGAHVRSGESRVARAGESQRFARDLHGLDRSLTAGGWQLKWTLTMSRARMHALLAWARDTARNEFVPTLHPDETRPSTVTQSNNNNNHAQHL